MRVSIEVGQEWRVKLATLLTGEFLICWHCWCCPPPQRELCHRAGVPDREIGNDGPDSTLLIYSLKPSEIRKFSWPIYFCFLIDVDSKLERQTLSKKSVEFRSLSLTHELAIFTKTLEKLRGIENTEVFAVIRKRFACASMQITIRCQIIIEVGCVAAWKSSLNFFW